MKLSPPKQITLLLSVLLIAAGFLGKYAVVAALTPYTFWLVAAGGILCCLGCLFRGL